VESKASKSGAAKSMAPRILFPTNGKGRKAESPHIYVSSPGKENEYSPNRSPLRDFLSVQDLSFNK